MGDAHQGDDPPTRPGRRPGADASARADADEPATRPGRRGTQERTASEPGASGEVISSGVRYEVTGLLGRGGMGEIRLVRDQRIGREVAMKIVRRGADPMMDESSKTRFVREAKVQGQLEHPSIVPVYDLDHDARGVEFFTMQRVEGVTLHEVLVHLRRGDRDATAKYTRHRLLSVFHQICLGMDYAHSRGVVHRDVKPSNVMLGDFGEVFILDWGVAKVIRGVPRAVAIEEAEAITDSDEIVFGLGTPGYMSPEQHRGDGAIDHRSDVYSLGAILFRILTYEPLHQGSADEVGRSTEEGVDARASVRVPGRNIPPELDRICERATALAPGDRFQSARDLAGAIERYLEGDRDLELRRDLAAKHVDEARVARERALGLRGEAATSHRTHALREAGRALALDPTNRGAAEILAQMLLEPPETIPEDARRELEEIERRDALAALRFSGFAIFGFGALTAFVPWAGVRDWSWYFWLCAPLVLAAIVAFLPSGPDRVRGMTVAALACVSVGASTGIYGPLILSPVLALAVTVLASGVSFLRRFRWVIIGMGILSIGVPAALEWAGVLPHAYRLANGEMTIVPRMQEFPDATVWIGFMIANVGTIVITNLLAWRFSEQLAEHRRQLHLHAWHLRQLVPDQARAVVDPTGQQRSERPDDAPEVPPIRPQS